MASPQRPGAGEHGNVLSPLHFACSNGHVDVVRHLVKCWVTLTLHAHCERSLAHDLHSRTRAHTRAHMRAAKRRLPGVLPVPCPAVPCPTLQPTAGALRSTAPGPGFPSSGPGPKLSKRRPLTARFRAHLPSCNLIAILTSCARTACVPATPGERERVRLARARGAAPRGGARPGGGGRVSPRLVRVRPECPHRPRAAPPAPRTYPHACCSARAVGASLCWAEQRACGYVRGAGEAARQLCALARSAPLAGCALAASGCLVPGREAQGRVQRPCLYSTGGVCTRSQIDRRPACHAHR